MKTRGLTIAAMALAAFVLVGCGDGSSPTGASPALAPASAEQTSFSPTAASSATGPLASTAGSDQTTSVTSVAEILADWEGLIGSTVTVEGQLVRGTSESDEFIFSDGTGEIRVDFTSGDIPPMGTRIQITATVASSELDVISWQVATSFSCDALQEVRVRLTSPGFVTGPAVGLYLKYVGLPPGDKILDIWWDETNKPATIERLKVGEGDPQGDGTKFDLNGIVAWVYNDLNGPEERQIRVNLRVEGRDGQCARVRQVNVSPGPSLGISGSRGPSGLTLSTNVTTPSGSRNRFTASASVRNVSSDPVEGPVQTVFVTPPGFTVASSCRSGSSGGGIVTCNMGVSRGAELGPGQQTETVSVVYESQDIGGVTVSGAIGILQGGVIGQVEQYVLETGSALGLGVTNLRTLANQ